MRYKEMEANDRGKWLRELPVPQKCYLGIEYERCDRDRFRVTANIILYY